MLYIQTRLLQCCRSQAACVPATAYHEARNESPCSRFKYSLTNDAKQEVTFHMEKPTRVLIQCQCIFRSLVVNFFPQSTHGAGFDLRWRGGLCLVYFLPFRPNAVKRHYWVVQNHTGLVFELTSMPAFGLFVKVRGFERKQNVAKNEMLHSKDFIRILVRFFAVLK